MTAYNLGDCTPVLRPKVKDAGERFCICGARISIYNRGEYCWPCTDKASKS